MSEPQRDDESVERGAAEELSGAPLTETEKKVSERPASEGPGHEPEQPDGN